MAKGDVGGVISAEARSAHRNARRMTLAPRQIEHVTHDHVFVSIMRFHPIGRMNSFVVKTVEIDRVRAINRNFAGIDIVCDRTDQTEILVLVIPAERRREENQGQTTAIAEGEHFEFAVKPRGMPFEVTFVHFRFVISSEAGGEVEKSLILKLNRIRKY